VDETARVLTALGAKVETHVYPGDGHSVMREDIAAMRARLNG
jgi:predicted esterase